MVASVQVQVVQFQAEHFEAAAGGRGWQDEVVLAGTSNTFNVGGNDTPVQDDGGFNSKQRGNNGGMWKYMED